MICLQYVMLKSSDKVFNVLLKFFQDDNVALKVLLKTIFDCLNNTVSIRGVTLSLSKSFFIKIWNKKTALKRAVVYDILPVLINHINNLRQSTCSEQKFPSVYLFKSIFFRVVDVEIPLRIGDKFRGRNS